MIPKVSRGWRVGGLLRYLMGPGRFNEHSGQRVVATWDGMPELHQPPRITGGESGEFDEFDASDLAAMLAAPAVEAGIAQSEPPRSANGKVPRGPVWHCSLRNHASDRILSDAEWAEVIEEVMDRTGIARRGDTGGCRWVAVRHADDHVHIAAMLVRKDNGRRVHPYNDWLRAIEVCREAEKRLNLTPTPPAERTAPAQTTRAELEKTARRNADEPSRVWLRRAARVAAVQAQDPEEFFRRLADLGVLCRPKESPPGQLVGYAVAAPGDLTASGTPVWYSGGRLARDLTLPKLLKRWASAKPPAKPIPPAPTERSRVGRAEREAATAQAASAIDHATAALAAGEDADAPGVAHAAADMLAAVLTVTEHHGRSKQRRSEREHWQPADLYARAAGTPRIVQPSRLGPVADQLRSAAWRLIAVRSLAGRRDDQSAGVELLIAVAALIAEIAAYQQRSRATAQATAARRAAELLHKHHQAARQAITPPSAPPCEQTKTPTRARSQRARETSVRRTQPTAPPRVITQEQPGIRRGIR